MTFKITINILFIIIVIPSYSLLAQDSINHHSMFFEIFGPGEVYSINLEGFIGDNYSIRAGFSTWAANDKVSFLGIDFKWLGYYTSYFAVPLMMNAVYNIQDFKESSLKLELGVGLEYVKFINNSFYWPLFNQSNFLINYNNTSTTGLLLIGSIGIRYHAFGSRMQHRFSITPMFGQHGNKYYFAFSGGFLF